MASDRNRSQLGPKLFRRFCNRRRIFGKETFCLQRGHTAHACRRNGLAINVICYISGSIDAWNRGGGRVWCSDHIAIITDPLVTVAGDATRRNPSVLTFAQGDRQALRVAVRCRVSGKVIRN